MLFRSSIAVGNVECVYYTCLCHLIYQVATGYTRHSVSFKCVCSSFRSGYIHTNGSALQLVTHCHGADVLSIMRKIIGHPLQSTSLLVSESPHGKKGHNVLLQKAETSRVVRVAILGPWTQSTRPRIRARVSCFRQRVEAVASLSA